MSPLTAFASEKSLGIDLTGFVSIDMLGFRKIFRNRLNWTREGLGITCTGSTSEKSLGINLTGPDKVLE